MGGQCLCAGLLSVLQGLCSERICGLGQLCCLIFGIGCLPAAAVGCLNVQRLWTAQKRCDRCARAGDGRMIDRKEHAVACRCVYVRSSVRCTSAHGDTACYKTGKKGFGNDVHTTSTRQVYRERDYNVLASQQSEEIIV